MPGAAPLALIAVAAVALFGIVGCGGDELPTGEGRGGAGPLEPGGMVRIAVADPVRDTDPLTADTRSERLAARQIHEPLISEQVGPFGATDRMPGLAQRASGSDADTIWTLQLRDGVRFQDGTAFDADAVIANTDRWRANGLLADVEAVDSPRPGIVRFQLSRPDPDFPQELGASRLGLVAPAAFTGSGGNDSGTGPFELRQGDPGMTLLARNSDWWGTRVGLGPGLDQVELATGATEGARADVLIEGSAQVADELGPVSVGRLRADPLLTVVRGPGGVVGFDRSVRGIDSSRADQSLADVWLTELR
jgi:ABC-type transport system substrate-binding protein